MTSILTISAGLSTPSSTRMLADLLSGAVRRELAADGSHVEASTVELRPLAHHLTDALLSRVPDAAVQELSDRLRRADAIIVVTPIFNTAASALLKLLIDALDPELWRRKPVLLGASAGTARHALALEYAVRPMFAYLRADMVPTAVFAASGDFGAARATEADDAPLPQRARRAARELAVLLAGAREESADATPPPAAEPAADGASPTAAVGEFADFVPMASLLPRA